MDPISAVLLGSIATGAGGEAGKALWLRLTDLVRRKAQDEEAQPPVPSTGELELARLDEDPHAPERAQALSEALMRRAEQDSVFRAGLTQWHQQAQALRTGDGETSNTISGGTQKGPVLQGRDFSGINFNGPGQN
ncbi:hypothetical protein [Streptomyces angustmyceticus]|uniref:hypothetical protein n=1 Tax=Streptomyces angustmyceticus TaxID=285578 RepID=UPI003808C951